VLAKTIASLFLALFFYQLQLHWGIFSGYPEYGQLAGERRHG